MNANQQTHNRDTGSEGHDQYTIGIASEKICTFKPSQAFTRETLEDIRDCIGFKVSRAVMSFVQFTTILDALMTVSFTLGVATDGFRYVAWGGDDHVCSVLNSSHTYTLKISDFAPSVKSIILDHITDGRGSDSSATEDFRRYVRTIREFPEGPMWQHDFVLDPIEKWEGSLPTRKQVLDSYKIMYVRPAIEGDEDDE
jgi:hypothetical protein